jgi:hypothetical protein
MWVRIPPSPPDFRFSTLYNNYLDSTSNPRHKTRYKHLDVRRRLDGAGGALNQGMGAEVHAVVDHGENIADLGEQCLRGIYLISQVALWLTIRAGRPPTVS